MPVTASVATLAVERHDLLSGRCDNGTKAVGSWPRHISARYRHARAVAGVVGHAIEGAILASGDARPRRQTGGTGRHALGVSHDPHPVTAITSL